MPPRLRPILWSVPVCFRSLAASVVGRCADIIVVSHQLPRAISVLDIPTSIAFFYLFCACMFASKEEHVTFIRQAWPQICHRIDLGPKRGKRIFTWRMIWLEACGSSANAEDCGLAEGAPKHMVGRSVLAIQAIELFVSKYRFLIGVPRCRTIGSCPAQSSEHILTS